VLGPMYPRPAEIEVFLLKLKRRLENSGFSVFQNLTLPGASGVNHRFDLVVQSVNEEVAVTVINEVEEIGAVIMLVSRAIDVKAKQLLVCGRIGAKAFKALRKVGFRILVGFDVDEAYEAISEMLG